MQQTKRRKQRQNKECSTEYNAGNYMDWLRRRRRSKNLAQSFKGGGGLAWDLPTPPPLGC